MFGKLGDMAGMMKKAKEMQQNMASTQEELARTEVNGSSVNGEIDITLTCDMSVKCVNIKQECFDTMDRDVLENLVLNAVNSAISAAKAETQAKMSELTGGLDIPGM